MYKVMLVDDEIWVLKNLMRIVDWSNYNMVVIATATDGIEAQSLIKENAPDVLITDLRMPGMDGLELIKRCRQIQPEAVCVILSGYSEFSYAQQAMRLNTYDYLLKPIDAGTLESLLLRIATRLMETHEQAPGQADAPSEQDAGSSIDMVAMNTHVSQVIEFINDYYQKDLSLSFIAEKLHLNPSYLSAIFSKTTNTTFSRYVASVRAEKAARFLLYTDYSVKDIAAKVGFHEYRQFINTFKRVYGETPSQYRKARNGGFHK